MPSPPLTWQPLEPGSAGAVAACDAWSKLSPAAREPEAVLGLVQKGRQRTVRKSTLLLLRAAGPRGSNVVAKRADRDCLVMERQLYTDVLPRLHVSAPECHGYVEDVDEPWAWLFMEDAGGQAWDSTCGEDAAAVGRWLAHLHTSAATSGSLSGFPDHGTGYYLTHLRDTRRQIAEGLSNRTLTTGESRFLEGLIELLGRIESQWPELVGACGRAPETLVHGDLIQKNVMLRRTPGGVRVMVVDWECAGIGSPAADLHAVDVRAYWSVARHAWPDFTKEDARALAGVAALFRNLAAAAWESESLKYTWVKRSLRHLALYDQRLRRVLERQ